jgi:hypothetical protein
VRISGTSPLRISTVESSSGSSGTTCWMAWPVPSCGIWRTKVRRWRDGCLDRVGAMAGDDDGAFGLQAGGRIQNMLQ